MAVVPFGNPVDATERTTETGREEEAGGAATGAVMSREPATARVPRVRARRRGRRDGAAERVRGEAEENGGSQGVRGVRGNGGRGGGRRRRRRGGRPVGRGAGEDELRAASGAVRAATGARGEGRGDRDFAPIQIQWGWGGVVRVGG